MRISDWSADVCSSDLRALAGHPSLLLLDEPTEGIQPNIVQQIEDALLRVRTELGVAIMIVEQNLDFAWSFADRYFVMQRGRIVKEGKTAEDSAADVAHLEIGRASCRAGVCQYV